MFKCFVSALLILTIACLTQTVAFAAKKHCCCTHSPVTHCTSCAQTGNGCCPVSTPTPAPVLGLPDALAFIHPPKELAVFNFAKSFRVRFQEPLLPPPKEV